MQNIMLRVNNNYKINSDKFSYTKCIKDDDNILYTFHMNKYEKLDSILSCENVTINTKDVSKIIFDTYTDLDLFLSDNTSLKQVPIFVNDVIDLDEKSFNKLSSLKQINDNIYVRVNGNSEYVHVNEFISAYAEINKLVSIINKYNLSPLEQCMFAYDLVRSRTYKKESNTSLYFQPRDLTSCLIDDEIVCLGYSNIFMAILNNLGIYANVQKLHSIKSNESGHARNIAHIIDEKYNINGIYYFDLTWDSNKIDKKNNYLNSYQYFALSKNMIDTYSTSFIDYEHLDYTDQSFYEIISGIKNDTLYIDEIVKLNEDYCFFTGNNDKLLNKQNSNSVINRFYSLCNISNSNLLALDKVGEYYDLFHNSKISPEVFLQVLYNVRKLEYFIDSDNYDFDLDTFYKIYVNSLWSKNTSGEISFKDFMHEMSFLNDIMRKNKIDLGIARVRIAKKLSNICNNIKEK